MAVRGEVEREATAVAADDIRAALSRLLASPELSNSAQLGQFLSYVVTAALEGQADRIKGYTIATEALGRPEDFDPQTDPIVRVEAIRLRRALAAYYDRVGDGDPVRIDIARGGYVPQFTRIRSGQPATASDQVVAAQPARPVTRAQPLAARLALPIVALGIAVAVLIGVIRFGWWTVDQSPPNANQPSPVVAAPSPPAPVLPPLWRGDVLAIVQVMPIESESGDTAGARRLTSHLIDALSRFDEILVVTPPSAGNGGPRPSSETETRRAHFQFRGFVNVVAGDVLFSARVEEVPTNEVVWSRSISYREGDAQAEAALVRKVSTAIAQPYGVITARVLSRLVAQQAGDPTPQACLLAAFSYWRNFTEEQHARTRICLEHLVEQGTRYPEASALLTYFYLDEHRFRFNPRPGRSALDDALATARRAVELKPHGARALVALCSALFFRSSVEEALRHCEEARRINPYDTDIIADLGVKRIIAGDVVSGLAMIAEAAAFNPARPIWQETFEVLGLYLVGDIATASTRLKLVPETPYPLAHLVRVLVGVATDDLQTARSAFQTLVHLQPEFGRDTGVALRRHLPNDDLVRRLLMTLGSVGLGQQ